MASNNFKAFGIGAGANVTSQADYEGLAALVTGFQSGKASSAQINKALRQSTTIAALIGQFIAAAGVDALDNGDMTTLVTNYLAALKSNLSLKTAASRDVGNGASQIPDMSYFANTQSSPGYQKLPGGLVIQWGTGAIPTSGSATVSFPLLFTKGIFQLITPLDSSSSNNYRVAVSTSTLSTMTMTSTNTQNATGVMWMAVGYI